MHGQNHIKFGLVKCYFCSIALYGAATRDTSEIRTALPRERLEVGCWRRVEKTSCTGCVKNKAVHSPRRNILHTIKWKAMWLYWPHLEYKLLLKHVIEGHMEREDEEEDVSNQWMTFRKKAPNCTDWRTRSGRGYGHVARQTTKWMNLQKWDNYSYLQLLQLPIVRLKPWLCVILRDRSRP